MSLQENRNLKVAYITTSFSSLSHTFIRREVEALREKGVEIGLFGVRPDITAKDWDTNTSFLYPLCLSGILKSFFKILINKPKYFFRTLLFAIFNEERNPYQHLKLIYHFFLSLPHAESIIAKKYNHIHAHFMNVPTTIAMFCSMLSGIPFSFTCHSAGELGLSEVIAIESKFKKANFIRVVTDYIKQELANLAEGRNNIHLIRCGIEFFEVNTVNARSSSSPYTILAVGRLVEKKGFTYLIEAFEKICLSTTEANLLIIGEGSELLLLQDLVRSKNLSDNVKFLLSKSTSEVEEIMTTADVVVVPSVTARSGEQEGLPTIIVEAMRLGIPVVATKHSGIPEIVVNELTGLIVNEKDPEMLKDAILRILTNQELRKKVVPLAYNKAKELFNINLISQNLIKLFTSSN